MGFFKRLGKVFKGFFALFVRRMEKSNPRALLEVEIAEFHEALGKYNENLARQAGMVERLKTDLAKQKAEYERLTARLTANYNAKNMELAGRLALEVKSLKARITENEAALADAEKMYQNLTRQREVYTREAQQRIEQIKQKLSAAEMAESQAKLAEIASATAFDLSGTGATLARVEEDLDERIAEAKGKARVAVDAAGGGEWAMKEDEQKALEAQALAEFAATMGLTPPVAAPSVDAAPAGERLMGPTAPTPAEPQKTL